MPTIRLTMHFYGRGVQNIGPMRRFVGKSNTKLTSQVAPVVCVGNLGKYLPC